MTGLYTVASTLFRSYTHTLIIASRRTRISKQVLSALHMTQYLPPSPKQQLLAASKHTHTHTHTHTLTFKKFFFSTSWCSLRCLGSHRHTMPDLCSEPRDMWALPTVLRSEHRGRGSWGGGFLFLCRLTKSKS